MLLLCCLAFHSFARLLRLQGLAMEHNKFMYEETIKWTISVDSQIKLLVSLHLYYSCIGSRYECSIKGILKYPSSHRLGH